jgi:hypothetical protein
VFSRSDSPPPPPTATAVLIFFSDGALFLGRVSSPSAVLARLREVRLATAYSAFSRCLFLLRSVCDSARRSSRPSWSTSRSRLESRLASPKAAAMKASREESGVGSELTGKRVRQVGQTLRWFRRYRSMQSLQNLCEQRR